MTSTRGIILGNSLVFFRGIQFNDDRTCGGHDYPLSMDTTIQYFSMPEGTYVIQAPVETDVKKYLTYWDEIACPYISDYQKPRFPHRDLLTSEGILKFEAVTDPFPFQGFQERYGKTIDALCKIKGRLKPRDFEDRASRAMHLSAAQTPFKVASAAMKTLNSHADGKYWSLGYSIDEKDGQLAFLDSVDPLEPWTHIPGETSYSELAAMILANELPVPPEIATIESILEFRVKRRAELLAFRVAFGDLCEKIVNSTDPAQELATGREKIQSALLTIQRVFSESWTSRRFESMRVYLSLDQPNAAKIAIAATGALGAQSINLSPAVGALAGFALNACLTFQKRRHMGPLDNLPENKRDFAYLYYAQDLR